MPAKSWSRPKRVRRARRTRVIRQAFCVATGSPRSSRATRLRAYLARPASASRRTSGRPARRSRNRAADNAMSRPLPAFCRRANPCHGGGRQEFLDQPIHEVWLLHLRGVAAARDADVAAIWHQFGGGGGVAGI